MKSIFKIFVGLIVISLSIKIITFTIKAIVFAFTLVFSFVLNILLLALLIYGAAKLYNKIFKNKDDVYKVNKMKRYKNLRKIKL